MKRHLVLATLTFLAVASLAGCSSGSSAATSTTVTSSPAPLTGQYAFALNGFDGSNNPLGMAGSFKADGAGHITGGAVDVNDNGVVSSSSALVGTYFIGADEEGTIVLTNTVGTLAHPLSFAFTLQTSGAFGTIMAFDANNFIAGGTMQQQNSSVFSLSSLAGSYIVTLNGRAASSTAPTSVLGSFTLGSSGTATNAIFDRSVAGVGTSGPTTGASAAVLLTAPDTNGRGALTISINDAVAGNTTQTFFYYAITANRIIAVESDAKGSVTVDSSRQSTPFTATTVNTTGAVFGMAGVDTFVGNEISAVGQLVVANQTSATLGYDSNDNGAIVTIPTVVNQVVTFDPTTGRGTIAVTSGTTDGLANTIVFYLSAPGTGFVLDGTSGTTNRAMAGTLTAQTGAPFSLATDFAALSLVRARPSALLDAETLAGVFGPVSGTTGYELLAYERFLQSGSVTTSTTPVTITFTGNLTSATTGRGTLSTGSETEIFYIIGPSQFVFISAIQTGSSPLFFASPQ